MKEIPERLQKQMAFLLEADKEKFITRQTFLSDGKRRENDAEHAWHLALMALILGEYANEKIDLLRVVSMVLIHDLVEIYAGDTFAYDEEGKKTQRQREQAAADRLLPCCRRIRSIICGGCGKNLRLLVIPPRRPLPERWITCSRPCSMPRPAASPGPSIRPSSPRYSSASG